VLLSYLHEENHGDGLTIKNLEIMQEIKGGFLFRNGKQRLSVIVVVDLLSCIEWIGVKWNVEMHKFSRMVVFLIRGCLVVVSMYNSLSSSAMFWFWSCNVNLWHFRNSWLLAILINFGHWEVCMHFIKWCLFIDEVCFCYWYWIEGCSVLFFAFLSWCWWVWCSVLF
jgi:hypothetical protein